MELMVVFPICVLGCVPYLKYPNKAGSDLSFYGRSCGDKVSPKVLFRYSRLLSLPHPSLKKKKKKRKKEEKERKEKKSTTYCTKQVSQDT